MNHNSTQYPLITDTGKNIDAHRGPWSSIDEYYTWLYSTFGTGYVPSSGVRIDVKQSDGTVKEYVWQLPDDASEGYWQCMNPGDISGAIYFDNIAALKAASNLKVGDVVITKGYYSVDDGGGSTFRVVNSADAALNIYTGAREYQGKAYNLSWIQAVSGTTSPYVDDATLVSLQNNLYADILVPANRELSFIQMGGERIYTYSKVISSNKHTYSVQHDNKKYMMRWLAFCDRRMTTYNLFIPAGVYSFSATWLLRNHEDTCACGIRIRGECMQHNATGTLLIPHYASQEYIIRVGYKTKGGYTSTAWLPMRDTSICNITFGTTGNALKNTGYEAQYGRAGLNGTDLEPTDDATAGDDMYRYVTKGALWLDACPYSQFDGLYFTRVAGTSLYLTQCYESHFGYTNIRQCGRITSTGYVYPMVYINAPGASDVSACYFYYFNFEGCYGNYFYSKTRNFSHNEFNNIQIEGSVPVSRGSIIVDLIDKTSTSEKYDTDAGYDEPEFDDAVFGRWYKWFVFTGNMGFTSNYVNSISASNFGNGFKRYRTYSYYNGVATNIDGITIPSDHYEVVDGTCFALDNNGKRIVDYYRHYALFGQDENNSDEFLSFSWNIGTVYLYRLEGMKSFNGPWVVYLRNKANTHSLTVNHAFDRNEYPYYFRNTLKGCFAKEANNLPGAVSFADILDSSNSSQAMLSTIADTCSPNGLCIKADTINAFSFMASPGTTYRIRAYCPSSAYDYLLSHSSSGGYPLFRWNNLLCIGDANTPYTSEETVQITHSGWITIPMPDPNLTEVTKIYFKSIDGSAYSNNFLRSLYLDIIIAE